MADKLSKCSAESVHSGHRSRMKEQFLLEKGRSFPDHKLLEMLLFYSLPHIDTNELAHSIINECGSLKNVIYASPEKLMSIKGVGKNTAIQINLVCEIFKRIQRQKYSQNTRFDTLTSVGELLISHFNGDSNERICALLFNSSMHLLGISELAHGSANSAPFDVRELTRVALLKDAARVIIAHNHPAGVSLPSMSDRVVTHNAELALAAVGVTLVEHIVVGEVGYHPLMQTKFTSIVHKNKTGPEAEFYRHFYSN